MPQLMRKEIVDTCLSATAPHRLEYAAVVQWAASADPERFLSGVPMRVPHHEVTIQI
jgi:hypothetical protein